jgi:4-amino-4-deoxy-L-arabinose transferase-like glycosyltransferase
VNAASKSSAGLKRLFASYKTYIFNQTPIFILYLLVFLMGIILLFVVGSRFGTLQYDEGTRSAAGVFFSRLLTGGLNNPRQYFAIYPIFTMGIWFYPFLYSLLSGLGFTIFGYQEFAARLVSVIFTVLLIHSTILISREITYDEKAGIVSGLLVATSPLIIIVGSGAMVDVPAVALTTYSLLFWIRGFRGNSRKNFVLAGILAGLAALMRPPALFELAFIAIFALAVIIVTRKRLLFSKTLLLGIIIGVLVFSIYVFSAFLARSMDSGFVGGDAMKGLSYWFGGGGTLTGFTPPWYSPQWFTVEGWQYYLFELIFMMGALALLFSLIGILSRLKNKGHSHFQDVFLLLFVAGLYILETITSTKNPRYVLPLLPILFVYAGAGLSYAYTKIAGNRGSNVFGKVTIRKTLGILTVVVVLLAGVPLLLSTLEKNYIPGMEFGATIPYHEAVQIITRDGETGLVMPDTQNNLFNAPALTFYLSSIDTNGKYGCVPPVSNAAEIQNYQWAGKNLRYVLAYNSSSEISNYIKAHQDQFSLIGQAKKNNATILVYKLLS